ncbi:hypothetical protein ABT390_38675 [Streptomyces aurantiacus]|uniref:Uncharacterized protein n=1 Tax=Streptomyces aurantiacus JA 4570 TaxID=1286094 RepID=S4A794_9ACTN|nr:hypothetical protein [Streptomyces aurantiacus]EPH46625.1 hypothetical protein STRAU_0289 [Streptomyces aurantiacus JA 4570]
MRNAARRRAEQSGQSYEAALKDVLREYEQGRLGAADGAVAQERMGFEEAADAEEFRPRTGGTGYFVAGYSGAFAERWRGRPSMPPIQAATVSAPAGTGSAPSAAQNRRWPSTVARTRRSCWKPDRCPP